jgi:WD40 repeat protein
MERSCGIAVLVGVSLHATARLNLRGAANDARDLAAQLRDHHGYDTVLLRDTEATRARLEALFTRDLPARATVDTPILVYFAGHGLVVDSVERPRGYLVPHDGTDDVGSLVAMEDLYRWLEALPCKHALVILDCCFAGAFRWASRRDVGPTTAPELYQERYDLFLRRAAWQLITSSAADERAADVIAGMAFGARAEAPGQPNSPFLRALLQGLRGAADTAPAGGDGVITATELYLYLRHQIERPGTALQTPGLWPLTRHEQGEYIFHVPGRRPTLRRAPELARETSPYRGLEPYDEAHEELLFGRDEVIANLVQRAASERLTIVVAPSGAGKSSVVRAGFLPRYRRSHPDAAIRVVRPSQGVAEVAAIPRLPGALVIVDQLEELLTLDHDVAVRDAYLASIVDAVDAGVTVVATLRSDFEAQMAGGPLAPRLSRARFPLDEMTRSELEAVIEGPATHAVLFFEPPTLVDRLVDAVRAAPGALPLLSFVLSQMYERMLANGDGTRTMREQDYEDLGEISGALRARLDALHDGSPDAAARATLQAVLLRMVEVDGGTAVRRPVDRQELDFGDARWNALVSNVWIQLTAPDARLATGGRDDESDRERLELVHDAVIRSWPRLDGWLRDEKISDDLRLQRRIAVARREWIDAKRDPRRLWHLDPRLDIARALGEAPLGLNAGEREFVRASLQRRRQRRVRLAATAATTALALAVLGLVAWSSSQREKAAQLVAAEAERSARREAVDRRGVVASSLASVPGKADDALAEGIQAMDEALQLGAENAHMAIDGLISGLGATGQLVASEMRHGGEMPMVWSLECLPGTDQVLSVAHDAAIWGVVTQASTRLADRGGFAATYAGLSVATALDGQLELWGPGGERRVGPTLGSRVASLAASHDGRRVVALGLNGDALIWSLAPASATSPGSADSDPALLELAARAFPADDRDLAGEEAVRRIVDAKTSAPSRTVPAHRCSDMMCGDRAALSPDGTLAATSDWDGHVRLWSVAMRNGAETLIARPCQLDIGNRAALRFSPRGDTLAIAWGVGLKVIATRDCSVVFDRSPTTLDLSRGGQPFMTATNAVVFSADGAEIISAGGDGLVRRWDARSGRPIGVLLRTARVLTGIAACGPGRFALGDDQGTVSVWHEVPDASIKSIPLQAKPLALAFAPGDSRLLAIGLDRDDDSVVVIDTQSGVERIPRGAPARPWIVGFANEGSELLASGRAPATLARWSMTGDAAPASMTLGQTGRAFSSRDGDVFGAMAVDGLHVWSQGGRLEQTLAMPANEGNLVIAATASDDGSRIAVLDAQDHRALIVQREDMKVLSVLPYQGTLSVIALSPDGTLLLQGGADGIVRVREATTGAVVHELLAHTEEIWAAAFSPDGQRFATAGGDTVVRVWDRESGLQVAALRGSTGRVFAITFADDNETLAVASFDRTVRLFTIQPERMLALACQRLASGAPAAVDLDDVCIRYR